MTLIGYVPLCVVPIDGNRDFLEQQNPRSTGTACNGRQRRSGCLIRIADDCRGWFLRGRQVDTLKKRDAAMAEAQRLMAVAKPLKEKAEATLARGGAVSDSRWRRLERLLSQIQAALNLSHRYHSEWQNENENN